MDGPSATGAGIHSAGPGGDDRVDQTEGSPLDRPGTPRALAGGGERTVDARLARLHLRGGLLGLARAELEQMAGAGTLDREALVDLAEARWRSGDLEGAAEAADAHIATGGDEPIARLILAEEADRQGRLVDARHQVEAVVNRVGPAIDRLFAGEPHGAIWPSAPLQVDAHASAPGRWGLLAGGREVANPDPTTWAPVPDRPPVSDRQAVPEPPAWSPAAEPPAPAEQLSWSPAPERPPTPPERELVPDWPSADRAPVPPPSPTSPASPTEGFRTPAQPPAPEPVLPAASGSMDALMDAGHAAGRELDAIEQELGTGSLGSVASRLALLLRLDPALAPVIISTADRALASPSLDASGHAALNLVKGDAYRGLGREVEATAAYQQAQRALPAHRSTEEES